MVNKIINFFHKLPFSNYKIGAFIRAIHSAFLIRILLIIFFANSYKVLTILLIIMNMLLISQLYYGECILTTLEQNLTHDNITVYDFTLEKIGILKNFRNRNLCSVILLSTLIVLIFYKILYIRDK
jgi:hypothetical protein